MRHRKALAAVGAALAVTAATASSAFAYPSNVTTAYNIGTIYGTCAVYVSARVEPGPAVVGGITAAESVECGSLSITPFWIQLSGGFGGTSLDVLNLSNSVVPERRCEWQKTCYWSRSKGYFPPGDHEVRHDVWIDLTETSTSSQRYSSVPGACDVATNDSGLVRCDFRQWVTVSAEAP